MVFYGIATVDHCQSDGQLAFSCVQLVRLGVVHVFGRFSRRYVDQQERGFARQRREAGSSQFAEEASLEDEQ